MRSFRQCITTSRRGIHGSTTVRSSAEVAGEGVGCNLRDRADEEGAHTSQGRGESFVRLLAGAVRPPLQPAMDRPTPSRFPEWRRQSQGGCWSDGALEPVSQPPCPPRADHQCVHREEAWGTHRARPPCRRRRCQLDCCALFGPRNHGVATTPRWSQEITGKIRPYPSDCPLSRPPLSRYAVSSVIVSSSWSKSIGLVM
jgi:hypothetical protein